MITDIEYEFNNGESVTVFNLNIEKEAFNSFVRQNVILKTVHRGFLVIVYYTPKTMLLH